jgi:type II secretory pathway pseudopilin PulG
MNNKKGISALIETVLLILVVIAAVGIVAGLLVPMIRTAAERTANCQGLIEITSATASAVTVTQTKDITPASINSTYVALYDSGGKTLNSTTISLIAVGTPVTTSFTSTGTPIKASVITTLKLSTGRLVACPAAEAAI